MITPKMWITSLWSWKTRYIMKGRWKHELQHWFTVERTIPYRAYVLAQEGKWHVR